MVDAYAYTEPHWDCLRLNDLREYEDPDLLHTSARSMPIQRTSISKGSSPHREPCSFP